MSNFWTWDVDTTRFQVYISFWYICISKRVISYNNENQINSMILIARSTLACRLKTWKVHIFLLNLVPINYRWHFVLLQAYRTILCSIVQGQNKQMYDLCKLFFITGGEINFDNCCTERHVYMILWYFKRQVANSNAWFAS